MASIESGGASIKIELKEGCITVFHGTDQNAVVQHKLDVKKGSWSQIWDTLRNLETVEKK